MTTTPASSEEAPLEASDLAEPSAGAEGVPAVRWTLRALAAAHVGLVLATALGSLVAVCVLLAVALLIEAVGAARWPGVARVLRGFQLRPGVRVFVRTALLVVALGQAAEVDRWTLVTLVVAVGAIVGARTAWLVVVRRGRRHLRNRVRWQGLEVNGASAGPPAVAQPGFLGRSGTDQDGVLALEWVLLVGASAFALTGWVPALLIAVGTTVAGVALFVGRAIAFEALSRRSPAGTVLPEVVACLTEMAPQVVVYFSSPASGSYALRVWVDTIRRLRRPAVVLLREAHHLDAVDLAGLAVVVLPRAQDVEAAQVPSMKVALYPTNVVKNNHMIRLPGIRHAFIGHGDSDKAGSFSPVSRVYDEIWVAGDAGRDRYLAIGEGVRVEQIRQVSRPQLAELVGGRLPAPEPATGMPTVLYAPTWEGFYTQSDYCSVVSPGLESVEALVASGRVRVLFKPHPATGERRADAAEAVRTIEGMIGSGPHQRVPDVPEALYEAMREADVLLSDVSSVLSDWLATGRPYLVANPQGWSEEEMHGRFPTTRGGALLDPGGDVLALLDEALSTDLRATTRAELAHYLLGAPSADPVGDFLNEVDAFVERSRPRPLAARGDQLDGTQAVR